MIQGYDAGQIMTAPVVCAAQVFQRKSSVIIGTTFMWVCAIAAAMVINADTFYYSIILPVLSGTSIWLINWLYED